MEVVSADDLVDCGSSVSIRAQAGTGEHHGQVGAGYGKELLCQTAHVLCCCLARVRRFQKQRQQLGCIYLRRRRHIESTALSSTCLSLRSECRAATKAGRRWPAAAQTHHLNTTRAGK